MNGLLNINKAKGVSSAREVAAVKRLTGTPCGHMGTLDPMAEGVLPVAVGNATRLFDYLLTKTKKYIATFRFGVDYDTLDTEGTLIKSGCRIPSAEEIEAVIPSLTGAIMQVPPRYSAKNINGRRGYQLARAGVEFDLPPKKVTVYSIKLLGGSDGCFSFEIECGGGTYIRSLARDMAAKLSTCAAMSALTRTASGPFLIGNSVKSDMLTFENIADYIVPCDSVIDYPSIRLDAGEAKKLFNGVSVNCGKSDGLYKLYAPDGSFYGIGAVGDGTLKARTKLC